MGRTVHGANYPWGELSMGRTVHGASCHGASCRGASFDGMGQVLMGQVLMGQHPSSETTSQLPIKMFLWTANYQQKRIIFLRWFTAENMICRSYSFI
jgi:hypothetical protein